MKKFKQLLLEMQMRTKEDLQKAINDWHNLPQAKKPSEAKKIIKKAKELNYPLKQQDILKFKDIREEKTIIKQSQQDIKEQGDRILKEFGLMFDSYSHFTSRTRCCDEIHLSDTDVDSFYIGYLYSGEWGENTGVNIKLPKTKSNFNIEYILNFLEKRAEKMKSPFRGIIKKFLSNIGLPDDLATSYGVGVSRFGDFTKLEKILKTNGIEYKTGHSEAGWVKQYIIRQSKENIQKMNNIKGLS
jgi:hypothetical protein